MKLTNVKMLPQIAVMLYLRMQVLLFYMVRQRAQLIDHQVSGNSFTEVIKLQAVKDVDGVCEGLFTGNVDVELSQRNVDPDPDGNSGLSFIVNNSPIAKYPVFTSNVTLNFGADSKAIIPNPVYLDAGKIPFASQL